MPVAAWEKEKTRQWHGSHEFPDRALLPSVTQPFRCPGSPGYPTDKGSGLEWKFAINARTPFLVPEAMPLRGPGASQTAPNMSGTLEQRGLGCGRNKERGCACEHARGLFGILEVPRYLPPLPNPLDATIQYAALAKITHTGAIARTRSRPCDSSHAAVVGSHSAKCKHR